jgi:hypothetical protein
MTLIQLRPAKGKKKSRRRSTAHEIGARLLPATLGGVHLYRRYRVDPALADLLAQIAGLGQEVRR